MEILETGVSYEELPDTYVIYIYDFDPVGLSKYRYTIRRTLKEDNSYDYNDGTHTVFLSTKGTNEDQVSDSLVKVFKYEKGTRCQVQLCDVFVSEHFFAFLSAALFGSSRLVLIDQEDIFCGK